MGNGLSVLCIVGVHFIYIHIGAVNLTDMLNRNCVPTERLESVFGFIFMSVTLTVMYLGEAFIHS